MLRAILSACLCLLLAAAAPQPEQAPAESAAASLHGRWNIVFVMPQGAYETPVEFVVGPAGAVTATILGPLGTFRITDTKGALRGNTLKLSAATNYGRLRMEARVEGDRIAGKYFPSSVIARLFFKGDLHGLRDRAHLARPRLETFDAAWAPLEHGFYGPDYGGIDIKAMRARYRAEAAAARTEGELVSLMRRMLAEFR